MCFLFVPLLPEIIDAIEKQTHFKDERINDMASGLFNASYSMGSIGGPIFGAYLYS